MFSIASLINIPVFMAYGEGNGGSSDTGIFSYYKFKNILGIKYHFSAGSIGRVEETSDACNYNKVANNAQEIELFLSCNAGLMCSLQGFGLDQA